MLFKGGHLCNVTAAQKQAGDDAAGIEACPLERCAEPLDESRSLILCVTQDVSAAYRRIEEQLVSQQMHTEQE